MQLNKELKVYPEERLFDIRQEERRELELFKTYSLFRIRFSTS